MESFDADISFKDSGQDSTFGSQDVQRNDRTLDTIFTGEQEFHAPDMNKDGRETKEDHHDDRILDTIFSDEDDLPTDLQDAIDRAPGESIGDRILDALFSEGGEQEIDPDELAAQEPPEYRRGPEMMVGAEEGSWKQVQETEGDAKSHIPENSILQKVIPAIDIVPIDEDDGDDAQTDDAGAENDVSDSPEENPDTQEDSAETSDADVANESDAGEQKELSQEEINEKQKEAIKEGIIKLLKGELNKDEKGNLAEMIMDQYYISQGYTPLHERVTSLDQKGHKGIDGIYEKEGPDGKKQYVIADAKYGQSPLGDTKDGTKQMSEDWIDDRLDDSVGKEKADEIREAAQDGRVETSVFHVDIAGNDSGQSGEVKCETQSVDETGSKIPGTKQEVQTYDANGDVKEEQS